MTSSRVLPFVALLALGACGGGGSAAKATGVDCGDAPSPWTSGGGAVTLTVDGASPGAAWSRFYEGAVATDHANTILSSAWGRNAQNALKKGHDQAGFRYARFHGILNRDIAVYSEDASGNAVYDWTRFDMVYDAIKDAGMRPIVEISFMPDALASDASKIQAQLWYGGVSPNISKPTKPPTADGTDPWYFTAVDWRTGQVIYKRLAGTGLGFNNNWAPVTLGPDGTAYVGALGGLVLLRDR